jgi:hypothetical protein
MPIKPIAYRDTAVAVSTTQEEIRRILVRYGCGSVATAEDMQRNSVILRFSHLIEGSDRAAVVRLSAKVPEPETPTRIRYNTTREKILRERLEANRKATWRALYYAVKSRMESITYGIESFEQAFLAHVEIVSEEGEKITFGDWALPRLASGRLALKAREE